MPYFRYLDRLERARSFLVRRIDIGVDWCVILGSGLGGLGDALEVVSGEFYTHEIPGFPASTVAGHAGKLVIGKWADRGVVVMEGRFHRYEGHDWKTLVLPVRVAIKMGVTHFIITNAAGGIREDLIPGTSMLITDHINLMGGNPLIGPNLDVFGPRFPSMTDCYDLVLRNQLKRSASTENIFFKEGVYAALEGPGYETPAEIRMLRTLGADAVGMSTVPEVMAIRHAGRKVAAISMITNYTGDRHVPTHDDVMATATQQKDTLHRIILDVISKVSPRKDGNTS